MIPMTERKKNLLVGSTMIIALVMLGWMILQFGGVVVSPLASNRVPVTVITDRADGVGDGSPVYFLGISVGQVRDVRMADDLSHAIIQLLLRTDARVPANVEAVIRAQGLVGGGAAVHLETTGPAPSGRLLAGAEITGRVGTLNLLPKEFTELAQDLKKTSQQFRDSGVLTHLDEAIVNISKQVTKAGEVMVSLQKIVGDEQTQKNIQVAFDNIKQATDKANRIAGDLEKFSGSLDKVGGNLDKLTTEAHETVRDTRTLVKNTQGSVDTLTKQISERLVQASGLLDNLNSITHKVDQGKGTAGMLINDPKLYEAMTDSAKQLNGTLTDLKRLVEQWEQEGISVKLN